MSIQQYISDPTFWVAFVTIVFAVLVFKPAKAAINGILDKKIEDIRSELDEARELKDEANALLAEAERRLAKSEEEAKETLAE